MDSRLIKQFEEKDGDTIYKGGEKNAFCGIVFTGIDINGKKNGICQQAQGSDARDHSVIMDEFIQEITKCIRREFDEINNNQSEEGAQHP